MVENIPSNSDQLPELIHLANFGHWEVLMHPDTVDFVFVPVALVHADAPDMPVLIYWEVLRRQFAPSVEWRAFAICHPDLSRKIETLMAEHITPAAAGLVVWGEAVAH